MRTKGLQMKRTLRSVLFILLLSMAGMTKMYAYSFSAVCETGQTLYYTITDANNHYVKLTCPGFSGHVNCWEGYTKPTGDIILPETVQNGDITYTVTSIGERAFMNCGGMTGSLTIPNTVITIGREAFRYCAGFTGSLNIGNSVTIIDDTAFEYCSGFTGNLNIGNSVTTIGYNAFYYCSNFTSLTLPTSITEIDYGAFTGCSGMTGVYYTGDIAQWCDISFQYNNPLEYAHNLYIDNVLVTDLVIPDDVTEIKASAFKGATCLTSLTLSNSVTTIGAGAFEDCTNIVGDLILPESVTTIEYGAFYNCIGLTGVYYMGDIAGWCNITFDGYGSNPLEVAHNLYVDGVLVTDLEIPNTVTEIKPYSFSGATCLTSLTIPNSVTTIGYGAFYNCSGITGSLTLPNSLTMIGCETFYNCTGLTGVYYTGDLTQWCNIVFEGWPEGIAFFEDEDPTPCSNPLDYAHNLYIDNILVTDLVIPNDVTEINDYAFCGATCLTSLTIPNSVTTIGEGAFWNCTGLTSIAVFSGEPPMASYHTFDGLSNNIPVYVPCGCVEAYQSAAYWSEFTNIQANCTQQTVALSEGWNWVSFYVEFKDPEQALLAFEEALGEHGLKISGVDDFTTYADGEWGAMGDLEELTNDQMYMVLVDEDIEVTLEGATSNPADYSATIYPGWTWIGFPSAEAIAVEVAFADFEAEEGDKIMGVDGYSIYGDGEWNAMGDLEELTPGQGYMYFSNSEETKPLVFQTEPPTDTHDYVDLGLPSGLLWATCNVGASAPEDYGDYFAWGETTPKDVYNYSTYQFCMGSNRTLTKYCNNPSYGNEGFTDNLTTLLPVDDAATANWGSDWRMPTKEEFEELYNNTTVTWTLQNFVWGRLFTASNGNSLFLPAAGYRDDSYFDVPGRYGFYWSGSLNTDCPDAAWELTFDSYGYGMYIGRREHGRSVRPVRKN